MISDSKSTYVFGYGSLTNKESLQKTLPGSHIEKSAVLKRYQRKVNAPFEGYLYMNIVSNRDMATRGIVISVNEEEMVMLKMREVGYECIEVGSLIDPPMDGPVFCFVMPDIDYPGL